MFKIVDLLFRDEKSRLIITDIKCFSTKAIRALKLCHFRLFCFSLVYLINVYFNALCWTKLVICLLLVALRDSKPGRFFPTPGFGFGHPQTRVSGSGFATLKSRRQADDV